MGGPKKGRFSVIIISYNIIYNKRQLGAGEAISMFKS